MCNCKNVEFGSYDNQVELPRPSHMRGRKEGSDSETICVDRCLSNEIQELWWLGIATTGCCCGHNKGNQYPFIGVIETDIQKMKDMGYVVQFNPMHPQRQDGFIPKSLTQPLHQNPELLTF